jgi:hypothetical protein
LEEKSWFRLAAEKNTLAACVPQNTLPLTQRPLQQKIALEASRQESKKEEVRSKKEEG